VEREEGKEREGEREREEVKMQLQSYNLHYSDV
jgi:hypothetical protein